MPSKPADKRPIPTELDWGDYHADLDQKWAHDHYCGRSNEEMQPAYRGNPVEAASDLREMPEVPFRYYLLGYRDAVMSGQLHECDTSDAASCFLGLVEQKLEREPRAIAPIMAELLPVVEYIAEHQAKFYADEEIYGNFREKLEKIRRLYARLGEGETGD